MRLDRRQFCSLGGSGAVALTAGACAQTGSTPMAASGERPTSSKLKLGCQSGPSTDEHFAFFARYGVRNICAGAVRKDPARLFATVDELDQLQEMAGRHGLSLDLTDSVLLQSTHIDVEKYPAIMLAQSPQRDRDIEAFQKHIENCARAGVPAVKYNMSILGVLRNVTVELRGGAVGDGWNLATAKPDKPLTKAGRVDADDFWERITYFLDRVVPVAEEYKVKLACHPQDPGVPPEGYQGVDRVLGTVDGLKKFVSIRESPYHGLNFCQGTMSEDLENPAAQIYDVIRWFGERKKIFNVHFRNIKGRRNNFIESFPDDGDVNMVRAALTYKQVGYDGMLMPDHVPALPEAPGSVAYAYNFGGAADDHFLQSFAFGYGYIRGIIQAVDQMA